jgi:hypothetical protein
MHWQTLSWPFRPTPLFAVAAFVLVSVAFTAWPSMARSEVFLRYRERLKPASDWPAIGQRLRAPSPSLCTPMVFSRALTFLMQPNERSTFLV